MKLGDRVTCIAVLWRRTRYPDSGRRQWKYWDTKLITPREGIYIGTRTLFNGEREYIGSEEGVAFYPREHFRAALVVFSERENPVLVPIDGLEAQNVHA